MYWFSTAPKKVPPVIASHLFLARRPIIVNYYFRLVKSTHNQINQDPDCVVANGGSDRPVIDCMVVVKCVRPSAQSFQADLELHQVEAVFLSHG